MATAYAIPATPAHAAMLAPRLRAADVAELRAESRDPPAVLLRWLLRRSDFARCLFIEHQEAALFGVIIRPDGISVPWTLTARIVDRYPIAFWQASKYVLWMMRQRYPTLAQCIDARHEKALRWVKRLGFALEQEPHSCGHLGMPFFRATISREVS